MTEILPFSKFVEEWNDKKNSANSDLDAVLSEFILFFAYNSNKIEGAGVSIHQTREIFEAGKVTGYTGDLKALLETYNQKVCYEFLKEKVIRKEPVTSELIRQIHDKLTQNCYDEARIAKGERPGEYKKNYYGVGLSVGVPPEDVEEEIDFICKELSEAKIESVEAALKAAVWFHCSFERIHAFADGNGRVGRTILNYILMVNDIPPVIIFDEDKETYFMALEVFNHSDKIDGFVKFIKEQMVKTWCRKTPRGKEFIAL